MRGRTFWIAFLVLASIHPSYAAEPTRRVRERVIGPSAGLPADMLSPEGRTRWDLTALPAGASRILSITDEGGTVRVATEPGATIAFASPSGSSAASRWLLPDRHGPLRMGTRDVLVLDRSTGDRTEALTIETEIVGIGWVELPSGPREVVLQRALVLTRPAGSDALEASVVAHRWIDPLAGVVAEVSGTVAPDGRTRGEIAAATAVDEVLAGAADLKVYVDQLYFPNNNDLNWGWDRGAVAISSLTPDAFPNAGALIAANYWDFSANASGKEVAQIETAVNSGETCNHAQCGYGVAGGQLGRQDKYSGSTLDRKDNQVTTREDRAGDVTIWVWAGAQKEGRSGIFGSGESRYCYLTQGATTRTQVPLYRFSHNDAGGWYMTSGDSWQGGPFNCEQNLFSTVCGSSSGQLFPILWAKPCGTHAGTQSGTVLKGGVVKIPSGHTFNALLLRTAADFCVYSGSPCSDLFQKLDEVRTVVYLWQVPWTGTAALIQSAQNVADFTSWTQTENTIITYGLYPPLSIATTGQTGSSISLSWNPGNDTHRISGYKIYWDTDSGGATPYAFNSDSHPGQVAFAGTTATVSGLNPGTTYYFTVTSKANYTDPGNLADASDDITRTYESLKYPTQVSGDPSFVYPVEVQATTTATGGPKPVPDGSFGAPMTASRADPGGTTINVTWDVATCVSADYEILYGTLATLPSYTLSGGVCALGTSGSATWTSVPAGNLWFVVVGTNGSGTEGSWGKTGASTERGGTSPSNQCGNSIRDNSGTCP